MKYLYWETYSEANDRSVIELAFEKMHKQYLKAKRKLPKEFTDIYEKREYFHDMNIMSINIDTSLSNKKEYKARLSITIGIDRGEEPEYKLIFNNVSDIKMTFDDISAIINSFATWTYNELYIENKRINFNIVMVNGQEINIKCKKIDFEIIK